MKKFLFLTAVIGMIFSVTARASLISFEALLAGGSDPGPDLVNYSAIPSNYGSTAEVIVSYRSLYANNTLYAANLYLWGPGYGNLPAAAFQTPNGGFAEITLTPIAGYQVTLNSFSMAAYPGPAFGTRTESVIDVLSSGPTVSYGPMGITLTTSDYFAPNVTSSGPITIRLGTDWNNGINYINFDATPAVPEPATYIAGALLLLPFGSSALRMLRKNRASR